MLIDGTIQLGSITQNGKTLNFLVDNLGNIVSEVAGGAGDAISQIVGNYKLNMTEVAGSVKQVGQGLTQTTYSYAPLNALVDIVTNTAGTFFFPSNLSDFSLYGNANTDVLFPF